MMNFKEFMNYLQPTQEELHSTLPGWLLDKGYRVHSCEHGIIGLSPFGEVPTLVAHMDTINTHRCDDEVYNSYFNAELKNGFVTLTKSAKAAGIKCLGADDRAGIYTVIKAVEELESEHLPHIIFTTDEEIGCVGSSAMTDNKCSGCIEYLHAMETPYLIQVDRGRHEDSWQEAVYYSYNTDASMLSTDIENAGFITAHGSFTDIGELAPYLEVPAVNISASYEFEHTPQERLNWHMFKTNFNNLMFFLNTNWYNSYGEYQEAKKWGNVTIANGYSSHSGSEDWYDVASEHSVYDMKEIITDVNELAYASGLDEDGLDDYLYDIFGNNTDYREQFIENMYAFISGEIVC